MSIIRKRSGQAPLRAGLLAATFVLAGTATAADDATVERVGNTRPEVLSGVDHGRVADSLPLDHVQLLLKRPAEREAALADYIDGLTDKQSSHFHQWLTPQQLRAQYAPAYADVERVSAWLRSQGLVVNHVQASGMVIDFSGTAGQVGKAFQTEIHRIDAHGASHIANVSNPRIPAALSEVVDGVVSLHDFRPHTNYKSKPAYTFTSNGETFQAVVPADLAKIYNLMPLFAAGITGKGQTITVIEDTNVFSTKDWTTFRTTFGLSQYTTAKLTQVHPAPPTGATNCKSPGVVANNEGEAELDVEWASAGAPGAKIQLASCKDTSTTFGGLIALQNLVNSSTPPTIVTISYGECEAYNGATANAAFKTAYQQAAAEGASVYVSSGDEGAASCDANLAKSTHGIGVSGFASTVYNVAVGGTDFGDTSAGTSGTYWSATNGSTDGSALSYIPEIPWNDSCASSLIATALGFSTTYGTTGACNSAAGESNFLTTASGSGGPSGCATGAAKTSGVVSGSCAGYAKPSWQALVGNPADGVRDIPDVSLFAANGVWGHYYVFCDSDTGDGGTACTGAPSGWSGAGGTSFASPIWAGFQALVDQFKKGTQGNPNPTLYSIANAAYGANGSPSCNSSNGNAVASTCVFYDVTQGDMDVNCTGKNNCYNPGGTNGVLSTSTTSYAPAYGTGTGWDFATGIGSVNVYNLVHGW